MERKFFIKVSYLFVFLTWVISFDSLAMALPCYKNFQDTDVITTKIKLGYWKSKTYIKDYDYLWREDGLNASLGFNPLHSIKFLQNLYINLQTDLTFSSDIKNNNIFLTLEYNLPITLKTLSWMPDFVLFGSIGGGKNISNTKNVNISPIFIDKFNNIKLINYGLMVIPSKLRDTNYSIYIESKIIYSKYVVYENNNKIYSQYRNTFVTIGISYKIDYLINRKILNGYKQS